MICFDVAEILGEDNVIEATRENDDKGNLDKEGDDQRSRGIETDDQLNPKVNEELHDFYEGPTAKETDDQPNSEDGVKNNDGYQSQEPEVIKLMFKGSFSKNSKEIVENINKINKICFGNDKMDGCEDFSSPENQSCVNNSTLETPVVSMVLVEIGKHF